MMTTAIPFRSYNAQRMLWPRSSIDALSVRERRVFACARFVTEAARLALETAMQEAHARYAIAR